MLCLQIFVTKNNDQINDRWQQLAIVDAAIPNPDKDTPRRKLCPPANQPEVE
jgi:hypothetical protein